MISLKLAINQVFTGPLSEPLANRLRDMCEAAVGQKKYIDHSPLGGPHFMIDFSGERIVQVFWPAKGLPEEKDMGENTPESRASFIAGTNAKIIAMGHAPYVPDLAPGGTNISEASPDTPSM